MRFSTKCRLILFALSLGQIILFQSCNEGERKRLTESWKGVYRLKNYPGCDPCHLELRRNNKYCVFNGDTLIEDGYWAIEFDIESFYIRVGDGQLGMNQYAYLHKLARDVDLTD